MVKKIFNTKNLIRFVFLTFVASNVFVIIRMILSPAIAPLSDTAIRVKSDYILMLLQSLLGITAMLLPGMLNKKFRLSVPSIMIIFYAVFLYCAIYLGEVRAFYYRVPHWDTTMHTFSGAALGALGFSVVSLLNKSDSAAFHLSPGFVALFSFCFALMLGVLWEIYEFAMDYFLGTNMQKFMLESGELLIGQKALTDTMKDLIVDAIGAFTMSVIGYISLKYNKGWIERVKVKQMPQ